MELYFNELSLKGKESIGVDCVSELIKVYRGLRKYDITTCRIDSADNLKLFQMIQNMPDAANIKNFYFSFLGHPMNQWPWSKSRMNILHITGLMMADHV